MTIIETERLLLRTWREKDEEPCYHLNQDPRVIEFLPGPLSMEKTKEFIDEQNRSFLEKGYAFWAVEEKNIGMMIGFCGLMIAKEPLPASSIEIGWRFSFQSWGQGYATEAAKAVLGYGWNSLGLEEILSCTVVENHRSRRVMEKIGMARDAAGDFSDPEHRHSKHVLYRINKS